MGDGNAVKVVVRLLPPEITEEEFKATVSEVHKDNVKSWSFQPGERSKGDAKPSVNSRCYMQFGTAALGEEFISSYHGHPFVDAHGETFRAVTCLCPYQKVPRKNQKDSREGTLFDDPVYKEFVENLSIKREFEPPTDPKLSFRPSDPSDTPLLQYMKTRAIERKARWAKRKERWSSYMEQIPEETRRPKWFCSECFATKNLEEDPDDRGTFYCTYCWEFWETSAVETKKKKKKKKNKEEEWDETYEEEYSSKKKKKRHKEEEEWRVKEWDGEEETTKKKKKKKKEETYEEDEGWGSKKKNADAEWGEDSRWTAKKGKGDEWGEEWSEDWSATEKKKKKKSKYKDDEWWEEPTETTKSKSRSSRYESDDKWKVKGHSESSGWGEGESSSKSKRKGKDGDEGGRRWAPRSKSYK